MTETKKEILKRAQHYIQERGYNGFTMQDLANDIGIRKASLFYHFKSKDEIIVNALKSYRIWFERWSQQIDLELSSEALLDSTFTIYRKYFLDKGLLCPLTMLSAEYENLSKDIKAEVDGLLLDFEDWYTKILDLGKEKKDVLLQLDSRSSATFIMSTLSGLLKLCRLKSSTRSFENSIAMMKNMVLVRDL